jgi:type VI secretion system protein ImpM
MALGFYGKLPAHGDFIERRWSGSAVAGWDEWLQRALAISREQLGERWLDTYLTSPLWRFGLSAGCVDGNHWLGVLLPSVDSVGRYFPLVLGTELTAPCHLVATFLGAEVWFTELEQAALAALDQNLDAEQLAERLQALPALPLAPPAANGAGIYSAAPLDQALPQLLEWQWRSATGAASLWRTQGSDAVRECLLMAAGMAPASGYAAMLDGDWRQWGWAQMQ